MKTATFFLLSAGFLHASDFEIDLNAHLNFALATSTADEASLATHGHDPNDEFTLQGLEITSSASYGEYLSGFVSYNTFLDSDDQIDGELEEAFFKLHNLPGGFEFRAGRLLNRVTTQNSQHLHSWHFADANLITSRFLGDEGLVSNSIELSYKLPVKHDALLSVAFGDAIAHDEHGHDEHAHEEEAGGEHEDEIEGEGALLADDIISARLQGIYHHSDFHQYTYGLSYLHGKNGYRMKSNIFGGDLTYLWRENGLESGGKHLRATVEPIYREFDYSSEDGDVKGSASEWGVHTGLGWGFTENWELGLRFDYLEGVGEPVEELSERHRSTAALTRSLSYNELLSGHVRLQYNHDWTDTHGHEDTVFLQFQIDLGAGGEIR